MIFFEADGNFSLFFHFRSFSAGVSFFLRSRRKEANSRTTQGREGEGRGFGEGGEKGQGGRLAMHKNKKHFFSFKEQALHSKRTAEISVIPAVASCKKGWKGSVKGVNRSIVLNIE